MLLVLVVVFLFAVAVALGVVVSMVRDAEAKAARIARATRPVEGPAIMRAILPGNRLGDN